MDDICISAKDIKLPKKMNNINSISKIENGYKFAKPDITIPRGIDISGIKPVINIKPTALPVINNISISDLSEVIDNDRSTVGRNGTQ